MKFVAVTSCPTGIAHTYMAAENLEQAGKAAGHEVQVETQGSAGTVPLPDDVIAAADGVIYAADLEVKGKGRFAGKPFIDVGVKKAVHDGPAVLAAAVAAVENAPKGGVSPIRRPPAPAPPLRHRPARPPASVGVGTRVRQWLMTGVSYMIPFVAAGGILIALGFLFGGDSRSSASSTAAPSTASPSPTRPARCPWRSQKAAASTPSCSRPDSLASCSCWAMLRSSCWCPSCPGYIAFAIADRPGLVPGIVGGLLAGLLGAGFLGGLVSGFAAGGIAYALTRLRYPRVSAASCRWSSSRWSRRSSSDCSCSSWSASRSRPRRRG